MCRDPALLKSSWRDRDSLCASCVWKDITNCWPLVYCKPWDTGQQFPFVGHWVLYTLFCSYVSVSSKEWDKALHFLFHISDTVNLGSKLQHVAASSAGLVKTDFAVSHVVSDPVVCCGAWACDKFPGDVGDGNPGTAPRAKKLTFSKINQWSYLVYLRKRCTMLTSV